MSRIIIPMDDVKDREGSVALTQEMYPIVANENPVPVDILGRQEMVEELLNLLVTLSEAKSSCAFALNGKWGSGKTFGSSVECVGSKN